MRWLMWPIAWLAIVGSGCNLGGEGEVRAREAWAAEFCAAAIQFYTIYAPAFTEAGDDFTVSDGGDEAVREYAKAAWWVADGGRTFVAHLEATGIPRDDFESVHEAHTANGKLWVELMEEFAGTLEEYLETHDSATLASAHPTFLENAESGYAEFSEDLFDVPDDALRAMGDVEDCRGVVE